MRCLVCLLLFALAPYPRARAAEPALGVALVKAGDACVIDAEGEGVTLVFTSPSGIGGATVAAPVGGWPRWVRVRFRYDAERDFRRLEGLTLEATGKTWSPEAGQRDIAVELPRALLENAQSFTLRWVDEYR